jgi:dephospho-CoA kinase
MKAFGLTGGIGMGKSAAEQWLRQQGLPTLDTDALARQVVEPGSPALLQIQSAFGPELIGPDGRLRREDLARIVFSDPAALRVLQEITHPLIQELWRHQLDAWRAERRPQSVVVIPLLFETGAEKELDATVCVACSAATQRRRLLDRGWSPAEIERRNAAQWPIEKKIALSDFVVWTEGGLPVLEAQLRRIFPFHEHAGRPATLSDPRS